jgi:hypothetical protein
MTAQLRTVAGIAIAGVAIGFAGLSAGAAAAITTEDSFLERLGTQGITYRDARSAEVKAELVCSRLYDGVSAHDVATEIDTHTDLTNVQAAYFVVTSVAFYCGDISEMFTGYMR